VVLEVVGSLIFCFQSQERDHGNRAVPLDRMENFPRAIFGLKRVSASCHARIKGDLDLEVLEAHVA